MPCNVKLPPNSATNKLEAGPALCCSQHHYRGECGGAKDRPGRLYSRPPALFPSSRAVRFSPSLTAHLGDCCALPPMCELRAKISSRLSECLFPLLLPIPRQLLSGLSNPKTHDNVCLFETMNNADSFGLGPSLTKAEEARSRTERSLVILESQAYHSPVEWKFRLYGLMDQEASLFRGARAIVPRRYQKQTVLECVEIVTGVLQDIADIHHVIATELDNVVQQRDLNNQWDRISEPVGKWETHVSSLERFIHIILMPLHTFTDRDGGTGDGRAKPAPQLIFVDGKNYVLDLPDTTVRPLTQPI